MNTDSYTTTIEVMQKPEEVFKAINDVSAWWSGKIEGDTKSLGDEFTYQYKEMHKSMQKITEMVQDKRIVWHVVDANISFTKVKDEWKGTDIIFDISEKDGKTVLTFTHQGLKSSFECYNACSEGWKSLITGNLYKLITTGEGQPDVFA